MRTFRVTLREVSQYTGVRSSWPLLDLPTVGAMMSFEHDRPNATLTGDGFSNAAPLICLAPTRRPNRCAG